MPRALWPAKPFDPDRLRVWLSREFLVQEFQQDWPVRVRLTINRTTRHAGEWVENITWDELQSIKDQCGYGDTEAVEVYPQNKDVVNDANMRHLWVLAEALPFIWRR